MITPALGSCGACTFGSRACRNRRKTRPCAASLCSSVHGEHSGWPTYTCPCSAAPGKGGGLEGGGETTTAALSAIVTPPSLSPLTWHWIAWPSSSERSVYCALSAPGTAVVAPGISAPSRNQLNWNFGLSLHAPLAQVSVSPADAFPLGAAMLCCGKGSAGIAVISSFALAVAAELISSSFVTSLIPVTVVPRTSPEATSSDPTVMPLKLVTPLTIVCPASSSPSNPAETSADWLTATERPPALDAVTWHCTAWPSSSEVRMYCALSAPGISVLDPVISVPSRSHVNLKSGLSLQLPCVHVSEWSACGLPAILGAPLRSGVKTSKVPICEA